MKREVMHSLSALVSFARRFFWLLVALEIALVATANAQPTVTLSQSNGPPTTKLLVSGSGYDPYSAVDIYFDTKDLALAVTDGNGAFGKIGITVPGSAKPGGHWVSGVERYTGLAGQSRFLVETNWPQFHFSPSHSGSNPYENVLNRRNVPKMSLRWKYKTEYSVGQDSATLVDGIVYVGSDDAKVYALNGAKLWSFSAGSYVRSAPAVANGIVYITSYDHNVY